MIFFHSKQLLFNSVSLRILKATLREFSRHIWSQETLFQLSSFFPPSQTTRIFARKPSSPNKIVSILWEPSSSNERATNSGYVSTLRQKRRSRILPVSVKTYQNSHLIFARDMRTRALHMKKRILFAVQRRFFFSALILPKKREKLVSGLQVGRGEEGRRNGSSYSDFFRTGIRGETQEGSVLVRINFMSGRYWKFPPLVHENCSMCWGMKVLRIVRIRMGFDYFWRFFFSLFHIFFFPYL